MSLMEGMLMLSLVLKLIPILPQVISILKAAATELESSDPLQTKLNDVAGELESIAAAVVTASK